MRSKAGASACSTMGAVEVAGSVMAAGAPSLVGRLQQRRTLRPDPAARGAALVHHVQEGRGQRVRVLRSGHCLLRLGRELAALGVLLQPAQPVLARHLSQRVQVDEHGRAVALTGPDGQRRPSRRLGREAHHRLVHRADLLHVERTVGQALPAQGEQPVQHSQHAAVRHRRHLDRAFSRGLPLEERGKPGGRNSLPPRPRIQVLPAPRPSPW